MLLLAALLFAVPFEPSHILKVQPEGMNDKATPLSAKPSWCKAEFDGEAGWSEGRLYRALGSRGDFMLTQAARQLCEHPEDPTWLQNATALVQMWMNAHNCSQEDAEAQIAKAIAQADREKANEGKEPTDEERFAFHEQDIVVYKPEDGVDVAKLGKAAWCEGFKPKEKWDSRRIGRTISSKYGIEGTIQGAAQLCLRPDDATWQKQATYVLQKWMNWTHLSQADAEKALRSRIKTETFEAERAALCKALELPPEISGSEKAFAHAQQRFFGCENKNQTLWQDRGGSDDTLEFYMDPATDPPNEVVRMVWLIAAVQPPEEDFPTKDAMKNIPLLRYAVAQIDLQQMDKAALDKMLASAPYNDYARVVAMETFGVLKGYQKTYDAAIDKLTKNDADYTAIFRTAPKKAWAHWEKISTQWKAQLDRSNAFERKLSLPSRKELKGCAPELTKDAEGLIKSLKSTDYRELSDKVSADPIAGLLLSRLAVCAAYEKIVGLSGVLEDLVKHARNTRGPRSLVYYGIVDALAEALKDRPKLVLQMSGFYYPTQSLTGMMKSQFDFTGGINDVERTEPKGVVVSATKVAKGIEIKFKQSKYVYPEEDCVDDKSHPLKIDSDGRIRYYQRCKYTGKMVTVDTTPRPVVVAPQMATGVKPGVYAVCSESGIVHFTKPSSKDKKISTFYGFDL